ncbi:MAG: hypothetical protein P1P82_12945 [Bacteroidales bacterium]|nr:hypothetical protein [Bacteroidales bacterium]
MHKKQLIHNYKYLAFGLKIQSELCFPELHSSEFKDPDVQISFGKNPKELTDIKSVGVLFQAKKNDFLFRLDTVGSFRVQNGNSIIIEPSKSATEEEVRLFLLGSAIGALLQQLDLFTFHGSTVIKDDIAYVIGGKSGTGKSSLAATLLNKGFQLLADDISIIKNIKGIPMVYPGIPHLKLWADVMEALKLDIESYPKVRPQILKYRKPVLHKFSNSPHKLGSIVILNTKNTLDFEIEEIKGSKKFELLKENTYRYRFLEGLEKTNEHFHAVTLLAGSSNLFLIKRPGTPLQLFDLADFFIKNIVDS